MTQSIPNLLLSRRGFIAGGAAAGALALSGRSSLATAAPLLTVESTTLDVNGKAARVFVVKGPAGGDQPVGEACSGPQMPTRRRR